MMTSVVILAAVVSMAQTEPMSAQVPTVLADTVADSNIQTVVYQPARQVYRRGYVRGYRQGTVVRRYPVYRPYYAAPRYRYPGYRYYSGGPRSFGNYGYPYGGGAVFVGPIRIWW
jgi:hypothetical protein